MCAPAGFCLDPGKIVPIIGPQQPVGRQQIDLVGPEGEGRVTGQVFFFHGQDHIQLVFLEIGQEMVGGIVGELDGDVGIPFGEHGQDGRQGHIVADEAGPEPDHATGFIQDIRQGSFEILFAGQDLVGEFQQGHPSSRQGQVGLAVEQGRAALLFQTGDVVAQGLLGQIELLGRLGHVHVFGQFFEIVQAFNIHSILSTKFIC